MNRAAHDKRATPQNDPLDKPCIMMRRRDLRLFDYCTREKNRPLNTCFSAENVNEFIPQRKVFHSAKLTSTLQMKTARETFYCQAMNFR